ncbi:hypothetical protein KHC33_12625 [Methanospirillum sp. J.3.6.1-F.2.7.3]|uniref:Uncharacterized protein n=1 Tax=Methanospirillum purgamenti TaxID=2834276 RepID=A0A8E7EJ30_9EURY|nr:MULTISPECIES: hypothetical protein [Methanospirillum]MDX8551987.1 hypothetical protein [Methanospirillum hungatei]QVV88171.1 hypothetical protein KHC33_12625 [Methanospirillum sp. J.3.6.1-F.2.7.3]
MSIIFFIFPEFRSSYIKRQGNISGFTNSFFFITKNNEYYDDPLFPRKKVQTMNKVMVPKEVSLDQLLEIIAKADILIKAPDPDIL